ncbi:lipopolysaccharide biosynthesis protein [Lachnospiraceae bacterium C1.1]|nr:oligosaccharide flippase family protein [Lachnospiraceae bacterium C1.1]
MSSSENKKSAFGGFLSYFYGNFVVLLLGFVQTPLVTRIMSTDEYGRTGMFEKAVSIIYIFAVLGMDQAYIRYYYKEDVNRRALMRSCLMPSLGIVSVLLVFYFIFSARVNEYLFEKNGTDIIILVAAYTLVSVFERFLFLDVRMQQNGVLYSNINITQKILNIAFIFAAWYFLGDDFRVVLYAMTLSWGLTTLYLCIRYLIRLRDPKLSEKDGKTVYPRSELIKYGTPFILVLLMEWLLSSCDMIALKQWSDYSEIGVYEAAMKIMVILLTFKNSFIAFWSPVAMKKYEQESREDSTAFFRNAFDTIRFLSVIAAIGLMIFRRVVVLLLGESYRGADKIIPFLTLMPIFAMMFEVTVQGIKFVKKNMLLNIASAASIAVNIIGNVLLVPRLAGIGAAITTGLSYFIYFVAGSYISEKSWKVGYDYKRTFIDSLILVFMASLAAFSDKFLMSVAAGIVMIAVVFIVERKTVIYIFKTISERMKGG